MPRNTLQIEGVRLASAGSGVGFVNGLTTFVPGLLPGETAEIEIVERKKRWQRAQLVQILKSASERREPPCSVFGICGGCQLQHMDYASTLAWKSQWVSDALQRIGKVEVEQGVKPALGMEFPWRYRNKARLHRDAHGRLGYYRDRTHETVRFQDCLLLSERMNEWIQILEEALGNEFLGIRNLTLRENQRGEGLCLLENLPDGEDRDRLQAKLQVALPEAFSIWGLTAGGSLANLSSQEHKEVLTGGRPEGTSEVPDHGPIRGFEVEILGLRFRVSPLAFLQVNPLMTEKLYSLVLDWAELSGKERVWDLYSGIGTLTLALAGQAEEVWGIEENPYAVEDAKENALLNELDNVRFLAGRVEDRIMELTSRPDVVVLDPPRAGVQQAVIEALLHQKPERIIYVSCDPGTLARDTAKLAQGGYRVERVQPVDLFPWTQHVETVVLMSNVKNK